MRPVPPNCTQCDPMKRLAFEKTCGYLLIGALTLFASADIVNGQYYEGQGAGAQSKLPLNQLPPIVSSAQATGNKASKGLFIPSNVGNLPPIVAPPQYKAPFVYGQSKPQSQAPAPQVRQTAPVISQPNTAPSGSVLPPIVSGSSASQAPPTIRPTQPSFQQPFVQAPPVPQRSSAGVPIYQRSPATQQQTAGPSNPFGQSSFQGSGSRSVPLIQAPAESASPFPPSPSLGSQDFSLSPGDLPAVPEVELDAPGTSVIESPTISGTPLAPPPSNFPSVNSGVPGTNNFFEQPLPSQPAQHSQAGGVNTGCSSCGPGGCYDPAQVQTQNGCCGSVVNAGYYLFADALFWTRTDGDVQLSSSFGLTDFNFVGGYRFTLGYRQNATEGQELTFFGTGDLDEEETATSAAGNLTSLFAVAGGIPAAGFFNAVSQTQTKETQLQSLEYNRIKWGWDVLKTFVGVRYIYFDDSYSLFSTNTGGTNGLFVMDSTNNLFGIHGGTELFYDVGYRTSASLTTKVGGYVNSADFDTNVFNAGAQVLSQETQEGSFASTFELGFLSHLQLSPRSRFRLGYDLFLLWGAFTIENNVPRQEFANGFPIPGGGPSLNPATGTNLNTNNEPVLFHGLSFGFEVFR